MAKRRITIASDLRGGVRALGIELMVVIGVVGAALLVATLIDLVL